MKNRFEEIRLKLNLSNSEIEEKFELPENSWIDIESGVSEIPVKIIKRLLHLGVSVGWFFSGNGAMFVIEEQEALEGENIISDSVKRKQIQTRLKEIEDEKKLLKKILSEL